MPKNWTYHGLAVWKAIKELEKKGYRFEHSASGYRYLSADRYEQRTLQEALPMVATIQIADQVETTMKEAKLAALSELATPALFLAETQVAGMVDSIVLSFHPKEKESI